MGERQNPNESKREEHLLARELLGPYVLGALGLEEEKVVERHVARCAACREEERGLRETHGRLAGVSIAISSAPPDIKARLLAGLPRYERRWPRHGALLGSWMGWAATATMFLLVALVIAYSSSISDRTAVASLAPTELAPEAGGEIEVRDSGRNAEASLEVWGLPETGPNEYYELWFGREEGRVSAGTFVVDNGGRGEISALCPEVAGGYERVGITLEEFPEEPSMDSARVVLRGNLQES